MISQLKSATTELKAARLASDESDVRVTELTSKVDTLTNGHQAAVKEWEAEKEKVCFAFVVRVFH